MPATLWEDVPVGQRCTMTDCTNYATHWYGDWICCDCHAGKHQGLCTNAHAEQAHIAMLDQPVRPKEVWAFRPDEPLL